MMFYTKIKCVLDRLMSVFALIIFSLVFLIIAVLIKATSKGPVFFRQKRIGHNQRPFVMYKFRTMVKDAEKLKKKYKHMDHTDGPVFKIKKDPRLTSVGRFLSRTALDELPQFFNVLKGDMSIVGFRPPIIDEIKGYKKWQLERFKGTPGITSLWAVSGNHKIKFDDWVKMDIEYDKKISFMSDIKIMLRTCMLPIKTILKL